jgi:hypothetical protein
MSFYNLERGCFVVSSATGDGKKGVSEEDQRIYVSALSCNSQNAQICCTSRAAGKRRVAKRSDR